MREFFEKLFERNSLNRKLHWTTIASEKVILALVGILTVYASAAFIYELVLSRRVELSDLFLLFIYKFKAYFRNTFWYCWSFTYNVWKFK